MIDLSKDWTGDDVKRLCEEHGIMQRELAAILGIRLATVSDWVRGAARPSRLASVALTYLEKDLGGEVVLGGEVGGGSAEERGKVEENPMA